MNIKQSSSMAEKKEVLLNQNSDGLQSTELMTKCKNAVCCILARDNGNIRRGTGFFTKFILNGFEIKCIITNNHVLPSKNSASDGEAIFFYEGSKPGIPIRLEPDILFHTNEYLDYSLIGCNHATIEEVLGVSPLEFTSTHAKIDDNIFIFQHPKGEPKQFSYQKISNIEPPFLFYKADTDLGSSGSPVLRKFQLIAIHSKGCEHLECNKGTLCSEILNDLARESNGSLADVSENSKNSRKREALRTLSEASPAKKPSRTKQSLKQPEQIPTDKELNSLAKDITSEWKPLGRELGLDHKSVMGIHKDNFNYDDISEKAIAMLMKWKEKNGQLANFGVLRKALLAIDLVATSQKHC